MKRACTMIAVLFCLASPARAGFYLISNANSDAAYNNGASAHYDGSGRPNGPYFDIQQNPPVTFASGTMDTTGLATTTEEHARSNSGPYPSAPGVLSTADVTNSLVSGTFSASISDNSNGTAPPSLYGGASEGGAATFYDTLHFTIAGAGPTDVTYIQVKYQLVGQLGVNSLADSQASAVENSGLSLSGAYDASLETQVVANSPTQTGASFGGFGPNSGFTSSTPNQYTFVGTYALLGSSADVAILQTFSSNAHDGFSNYSGSLSIGLPSNVSFTSDSGVFLSASAVPEPASIVMLSLGMAGFIGVAYRNYRGVGRA